MARDAMGRANALMTMAETRSKTNLQTLNEETLNPFRSHLRKNETRRKMNSRFARV